MILKVVIEVVVGILLINLSWSFWQCVHSPKFLGDTLSNYNQMRRIFDSLGIENIRAESEKLQPVLGSYYVNMATWMKASLAVLDKARNTTLLVAVVIIFLSYLLGVVSALVNVGIFFLASQLPMSDAAKRNMMTDIRKVIVNVYKWNSVAPDECKHFCTAEQPRMFKNLHTLVLELSQAPR